MSEHQEFLNMIEIVSYALEIQGRTEESFRRSAKNATNEVARSLFSEIAEDFGKNREKLQVRKRKLLDALYHLRSVELYGEEKSNDLAAAYKLELSKTEHSAHEISQDLIASRDPVCDMQVNEEECQYVSVYKSEKYLFCCEDCQKAFELAPAKYVKVTP